jgi:hypothetical protein
VRKRSRRALNRFAMKADDDGGGSTIVRICALTVAETGH